MCTLSVSLSHTHTHSLTYMLRVSSVVLLYVYSMYIEYCCSVGSFGAKFIFIFDTFVFLNTYIFLFY